MFFVFKHNTHHNTIAIGTLLFYVQFITTCHSFQQLLHRRSFWITRQQRKSTCNRRRDESSPYRLQRHVPSMKIRIGLVGLPNVGKSCLFNSLAQKSLALSSNFPFCTIEPNIAPIPVPDPHLAHLGRHADSLRTIPAFMEWIDVAGLVKGASRGDGLGTRFLATVRQCDVLCHIVRDYRDDNGRVVHVDGRVDPIADAEVVNLEMILADLDHVERRLEKIATTTTRNNGGDDNVVAEREVLKRVAGSLGDGIPARMLQLKDDDLLSIKSMGLLTLKPVLYVFNVDEVDFTFARSEASARASGYMNRINHCDPLNDRFALVSAKLQAELSLQSEAQQFDYYTSLGVELQQGEQLQDLLSHITLSSMVRQLLNLSIAYTGPGVPPERSRTTRAYIFRRDTLTADGLAGRIHGDIQRGFIRAEVVSTVEMMKHPNYAAARAAGCVRTEGRDYVLNDEDVVLIKWN